MLTLRRFPSHHQDVPLSEISQVELARSPQSIDATRNPHVFEFRINSTVYYVGEDPTCGGQEESTMTSVESGVGLEQARSWENAIRQALMPVTARHSPKGDASRLLLQLGKLHLRFDFFCFRLIL